MVQAWMMDSSGSDQRLEHHQEPPNFISLETLKNETGVLYFYINPDTDMKKLDKIKMDRGYTFEDVIEISPEKLPNYEEKIKIFFKEHIHTDEEIRFVVAGSGYFDVRNKADEWIRVKVVTGDLIILPAGIYHRFTLDTTNYIKALRLFVGEPVWTPHNRPADHMEARKNYVVEQVKGFHSSKTAA